jgi:CubicO group peptidase (beta-lactamase class C family)
MAKRRTTGRKKTVRRKTSTVRSKVRKAAKPPRRKAVKRVAAKAAPRKRRAKETKAPRKPATAKKIARKTAKPTRTPRTAPTHSISAPAAQSSTLLELDRVLSKPIEAGLVPGVVAAAADDRGIFYKAAFGTRSVEKPEPMTADSVFRIASMTKAVTATAAMQLVERGRIGLDQPMGEVLPVVRDVQVLKGFDADGTPQLRDPKTPVTLRHLLTHTSGYGYDIFHADLGRYIQIAGLPSILTCKNDALRIPLLFDPGTSWEYGIGIDLAGKVVEAVSGETLESYFRRYIFQPLSMHDTSFMLRDDMARRLVGTHARGPDGKPAPIAFESAPDAEFLMGGGGLYSTATDYLTFTRMLLAGGTLAGIKVLEPATVKLMGRNAIGDIEVPKLRSDNPAMALEVEMFPGQVKKWGLSFIINTEDVQGGRAAQSLAWGGVHNTFFWIDINRRITAVVMMQLLPASDPHVLETMVNFEQALYAARSRAIPKWTNSRHSRNPRGNAANPRF